MAHRDGDGWVSCNCGGKHWGLHGAAGLLLVRDRSDIRKVDKYSRQSILWSASTISNLFIVQKKGEVWLLSDTK